MKRSRQNKKSSLCNIGVVMLLVMAGSIHAGEKEKEDALRSQIEKVKWEMQIERLTHEQKMHEIRACRDAVNRAVALIDRAINTVSQSSLNLTNTITARVQLMSALSAIKMVAGPDRSSCFGYPTDGLLILVAPLEDLEKLTGELQQAREKTISLGKENEFANSQDAVLQQMKNELNSVEDETVQLWIVSQMMEWVGRYDNGKYMGDAYQVKNAKSKLEILRVRWAAVKNDQNARKAFIDIWDKESEERINDFKHSNFNELRKRGLRFLDGDYPGKIQQPVNNETLETGFIIEIDPYGVGTIPIEFRRAINEGTASDEADYVLNQALELKFYGKNLTTEKDNMKGKENE